MFCFLRISCTVYGRLSVAQTAIEFENPVPVSDTIAHIIHEQTRLRFLAVVTVCAI